MSVMHQQSYDWLTTCMVCSSLLQNGMHLLMVELLNLACCCKAQKAEAASKQALTLGQQAGAKLARCMLKARSAGCDG
jgi:hypothetical protein